MTTRLLQPRTARRPLTAAQNAMLATFLRQEFAARKDALAYSEGFPAYCLNMNTFGALRRRGLVVKREGWGNMWDLTVAGYCATENLAIDLSDVL